MNSLQRSAIAASTVSLVTSADAAAVQREVVCIIQTTKAPAQRATTNSHVHHDPASHQYPLILNTLYSGSTNQAFALLGSAGWMQTGTIIYQSPVDMKVKRHNCLVILLSKCSSLAEQLFAILVAETGLRRGMDVTCSKADGRE